jgi:hypothetical protein
MNTGLHVQYPLLSSYFNQTLIFKIDFRKILEYWIHIISSNRCRVVARRRTDGRTDGHEDNSRSSQFSERAKNVFANTFIPHILCAHHYLGTHFCEDRLFVNINRSLNASKTERNSGLYQQRDFATTCSYVQSTCTVKRAGTALYSELPATFITNRTFAPLYPLIHRKSTLTVTPSSSDESNRSPQINLRVWFQTKWSQHWTDKATFLLRCKIPVRFGTAFYYNVRLICF